MLVLNSGFYLSLLFSLSSSFPFLPRREPFLSFPFPFSLFLPSSLFM